MTFYSESVTMTEVVESLRSDLPGLCGASRLPGAARSREAGSTQPRPRGDAVGQPRWRQWERSPGGHDRRSNRCSDRYVGDSEHLQRPGQDRDRRAQDRRLGIVHGRSARRPDPCRTMCQGLGHAVRNRTPTGVGAVVAGIILMGCGSEAAGPAPVDRRPRPPQPPPHPQRPHPQRPQRPHLRWRALRMPQPPRRRAQPWPRPTRRLVPRTAVRLLTQRRVVGSCVSTPVQPAALPSRSLRTRAATVFAGHVANAPGAPAMPRISGVGDGAFGSTIAGRSIVNAYSNSSRTLVAAQAPGALPPVEALARVALADN